jgi:hypothetical protein
VNDPTATPSPRPLSAILKELAPTPDEMDTDKKLATLDAVMVDVVAHDDPEGRVLLIDYAGNYLGIAKQLVRARMARALKSRAEKLATDEQAKLAASDLLLPPLQRFNRMVSGAVDGWRFLLTAIAPCAESLDDRAKFQALDKLIAIALPMPDAQLRDAYLDQAADHLGIKLKAIKDRIKSAQSALTNPAGQEVGGEEKDGGFHRALVGALQRYLQRRDLYPDAVNGWLNATGQSIPVKTRELVNHFHFTHASFFESLPRDRIDITLAALTDEARAKRRADILGKIIGKPASESGANELRRWLKATTGRDDPTDFAVMRHFLWQIKRLNSGRPVQWDLMPIFVGKQGDGKSTAIEKLCSVWAELMIGINAATLTDDRSTEILGDYAVGFWGEMSGGNKAEVQALKNTLTSKKKSYRELGGHHHNSVVRRMAFIGDTNNPVRDVINDPTGMRRFYEIKVNGRTDRDGVNNTDAFLAWQSVHEDEPAPFDGVEDVVRDRQKELVVQDSFDNFLSWCDDRRWQKLIVSEEGKPYGLNGEAPTFVVPAYDYNRGYTLTEIAVLFKHYTRTVGGILRGDQWVARRLGEAGWEKGHRPAATEKPEGATDDDKTKRPRYYLRPLTPTETAEAAEKKSAAAEAKARAEKAAAIPSASEDLYATAAQSRTAAEQAEDNDWREEIRRREAERGTDGALPQ